MLKINTLIQRHHPAAWLTLSPLGKRLYFPKGVPVQAQEAMDAGCDYNATIGQLKGEDGKALPLQVIEDAMTLESEETVLYQPQGGRKDLRRAWKEHIREETPEQSSLPVACAGLTHGLSICADLFVDEQTDVLLPNPRWGNYDVIFGLRAQGRIHNYRVMQDTPDVRMAGFDIDAVGAALRNIEEKGVLLLNFPSNPLGYTPKPVEIIKLVEVIKTCSKPLVIILDEAYKGMEWEAESVQGSVATYFDGMGPNQFLVVKVDGATKELFFFGGRIGFVTFLCSPQVAPALEEKVIASIRSSISALASPSQAMVLSALQADSLHNQIREVRDLVRERYTVLKEKMNEYNVQYFPFNAAFFVLVRTKEDAEITRRNLLKRGVGVVAVPSFQAIRVSYSTVPIEKIPQMVKIISETIGSVE